MDVWGLIWRRLARPAASPSASVQAALGAHLAGSEHVMIVARRTYLAREVALVNAIHATANHPSGGLALTLGHELFNQCGTILPTQARIASTLRAARYGRSRSRGSNKSIQTWLEAPAKRADYLSACTH